MADDLAHDLIGATVVGLGASLAAEQGDGASLVIRVQQLIVALLAIAELVSCGRGPQALAFALVEHGQLEGDLVILENRERAFGT